LDNDYLSKYFQYGQISNYKNIFRNTYILVFDNNKPDFDEVVALRELYALFYCQNKDIVDLNIINPEYINSQFKDDKVYGAAERLAFTLSKEMNKIVTAKLKFEHKDMFMLSVIISMLIIKSLKLSPKDIESTCEFLLKKWRPRDVARDVKSFNLLKVNKNFEDYTQFFYSVNQNIADTIKTLLATDEKNLSFYDIDVTEIIHSCEDLSTEIIQAENTVPPLFIKLINSQNTSQEYNDIKKMYYLIATLEMVINTIGINAESRCNLAYILMQLYKK